MSEPTRRSWLVTIGYTGLDLGIAEHISAEAQPAIQLPPGVYGPSSDHLGHALMSAEPYHPIPAGCPTDYVRPRSGPFTPLFFTPEEFATILSDKKQNQNNTTPTTQTQKSAEWI